MADLLEELSDSLTKLLRGNGGRGAIVSPAPGAGPESERTGQRILVEQSHSGRLPLGYLATHPGRGNDALGYGGAGDATIVDEGDVDAELTASMVEHARIARVAKQVFDRQPHGKYRMSKWYWLEGHTEQPVGPVMGPFSLFDGTIGAPSAGNSVVTVPISLPAGTVSPVYLLDRYPGALYMSIFIASFSFMPTAGTTTGLQEIWFSDITGATAGFGTVNAANGNPYENINKQLSGPLTDAGTAQLGTLTINNLGIGGTPTSARYQLSLGYVAMIADPWFNEQMVIPPTKAENIKSLLGPDVFA